MLTSLSSSSWVIGIELGVCCTSLIIEASVGLRYDVVPLGVH